MVSASVQTFVDEFTSELTFETKTFKKNIATFPVTSLSLVDQDITMLISIDVFSWKESYFNTYSGLVVTTQVNILKPLPALAII